MFLVLPFHLKPHINTHISLFYLSGHQFKVFRNKECGETIHYITFFDLCLLVN
jgi:hypothetical protein